MRAVVRQDGIELASTWVATAVEGWRWLLNRRLTEETLTHIQHECPLRGQRCEWIDFTFPADTTNTLRMIAAALLDNCTPYLEARDITSAGIGPVPGPVPGEHGWMPPRWYSVEES